MEQSHSLSEYLNKDENKEELEPVNIGLTSKNETESMLSNFAATPFELDGVEYPSVESFWQSIKFPENSEERTAVAEMDARQAKKASRKMKEIEEIVYNGERIKVGSKEHHELMGRAIKAKLEQNEDVLMLLLKTGEKPITHVLKNPDGSKIPDSKTIPGEVFSKILMDLREELRSKKELTPLEKTEIIKKIYFKGFGSILQAILNDSYYIAKNDETKEEINEKIIRSRKLIKEIKEHYTELSKDELEQVFPDLLLIEEKITILEEKFEELVTTKNENLVNDILELNSSIIEIGEGFRKEVKDIIRSVREQSGDNNFNIIVTDYKNDKFSL